MEQRNVLMMHLWSTCCSDLKNMSSQSDCMTHKLMVRNFHTKEFLPNFQYICGHALGNFQPQASTKTPHFIYLITWCPCCIMYIMHLRSSAYCIQESLVSWSSLCFKITFYDGDRCTWVAGALEMFLWRQRLNNSKNVPNLHKNLSNLSCFATKIKTKKIYNYKIV